MAKKYEIPEEEPQMVSEPAVAVPVEMVQQNMPVYNYSIHDLREKRTNADIARTLARTPEEYEDMKAHDFYSKGSPFPDQPQTWEEVWKEVDNQEEEIYLDETESNKAMERLWSVLA